MTDLMIVATVFGIAAVFAAGCLALGISPRTVWRAGVRKIRELRGK